MQWSVYCVVSLCVCVCVCVCVCDGNELVLGIKWVLWISVCVLKINVFVYVGDECVY